MSKDTERYTSYNEYKAADAMSELSPEDQAMFTETCAQAAAGE